jgi:hypothetical protein
MVSITMSARGVPDVMTQDHQRPRVDPALGRTARGRPPSPLFGVSTVMAVWWIAFGSALLQQWACG